MRALGVNVGDNQALSPNCFDLNTFFKLNLRFLIFADDRSAPTIHGHWLTVVRRPPIILPNEDFIFGIPHRPLVGVLQHDVGSSNRFSSPSSQYSVNGS